MILYLPSSRAELPTTKPAEKILVNGTNFSWTELRFDSGAAVTDEQADFKFQIHDNYGGGNITVRVPWKTAATSGGALWSIKHRGVGDDSIWDAAGTQIDFAVDAAKATAEKLSLPSLILSASLPVAGQIFQVRLIRKTSDPLDTIDADDAKALGLSIEFALV